MLQVKLSLPKVCTFPCMESKFIVLLHYCLLQVLHKWLTVNPVKLLKIGYKILIRIKLKQEWIAEFQKRTICNKTDHIHLQTIRGINNYKKLKFGKIYYRVRREKVFVSRLKCSIFAVLQLEISTRSIYHWSCMCTESWVLSNIFGRWFQTIGWLAMFKQW